MNVMDRTERLFAVMDALRRHRRPVTAATLADEMEVSIRTIYRDVQTLVGLGAPIDGEAGLGYVLKPGFFLPPLMFSPDELEALLLGAQWVQRQDDKGLATAAENALAKIATAAPEDLRERLANSGLWVSPPPQSNSNGAALELIREAIRDEEKLVITYTGEDGATSERTVWPFALAFYENRQVAAAWCELRQAFRHFRIDRIAAAKPEGTRYPKRRAALMKEWQMQLRPRA